MNQQSFHHRHQHLLEIKVKPNFPLFQNLKLTLGDLLGHDEMQQQAVLAMSLQEQLIISDDEESDEEVEEEACCGVRDEVYDDGEFESERNASDIKT